ncbi:hypothetical protein [Allosphingosinicella sp.]|uniref:hypothetical protein n=1 Tax=Allosphingosinicella sp. TaxID=2823234 RepID=UPI002EF9E1CA
MKALICAALLAVPAAASTQAPAPGGSIQPARWHLDGATSRCVLTRRLEGTPGAATFIVRTIPGSGRYDLILADRELPSEIRSARRPLALTFAPGTQSYRGDGRPIDLPGELGRGVLIGPLPAAFLADLAGAGTLRLASDRGEELGSWTLPVARRAAEALAYCEAEKQVEWGGDPASVEAGATHARPIGEPSEWLTPRDLGINSADGNIGSSAFAAVFRLVVGTDGRAKSCTLVESAGNLEIHGNPCDTLVRRARYEAARDPNGGNVVSVAIHIVSMRNEVEFRVIPG